MVNFMSNINTLLHKTAFNDIDFDIAYYSDLGHGKTVLELCAGFGRICNKLHNNNIDVTAIELDPYNFDHITLPTHKKINKNIFDCFDLNTRYDVILAPFNSFPLFNNKKDIHNFFTLLDELLSDNGLISLSYYHPDGWRIIPEDETKITIDGVEYLYTSDYDLSERKNKRGIWNDIFKQKSNGELISSIKYDLRIYENIADMNAICSSYGLKCTDIISSFYSEDSYEPGWKEFLLKKK